MWAMIYWQSKSLGVSFECKHNESKKNKNKKKTFCKFVIFLEKFSKTNKSVLYLKPFQFFCSKKMLVVSHLYFGKK